MTIYVYTYGAPAPQLSLQVNPSAPTIPVNDTPGGQVATLTGIWSNGATFTGHFEFAVIGGVIQNYGGAYAISGATLVVNPTGPGVGSTPTVEHVTIVAVQ